MKTAGHRACRQMLEDTMKERDEARAETTAWRQKCEDLEPTYRATFKELEQARRDAFAMGEAHVKDLRSLLAERDETIRGLEVELAMVREGLAP